MNLMTFLTLLFFSFAVVKMSLDAAPPNVLFIVADDLGSRIAPAGYPGIKTPNLDALAKSGMTFSRAYCQYPVCGPSRASFLSGLYPESTKVLDNLAQIDVVRPGTTSLPSQFQKAGYWTAATGKVFHKSGENPQGAWNQVTAFQNDEMAMETEARLAFEKKHGSIDGKNAKLWKEEKLKIAPQTRDQGLKGVGPGFGPTGLPDEGHSDGKNARQVAAWITNKAHGDRPFFIACGFQKPHIPFLAPDSYFSLYPTDSLKFDLDPLDDWARRPLIAQTKQYAEYGFPEIGKEDLDRRRGYVQAYHACVSFVDAQLGLVLQALKESGQWENTIIVFVGDNGYHLGEHFMWGKVMLFEESARIPMILRVPGVTKGVKNDGLAEMVDLYPTLTELCSVPSPTNLQGRSMAPMLKDPSAPGKESAYTVVLRGKNPQDLGRAIRIGKWRYTEWIDKKDRELYDLVADPRERNNLANVATYAGTVQELSAKLAERTRIASSLP